MIYLYQNISFLRTHHRLTYDELADKIGCTPAMLKTYTGKGVTPPLEIIINIANFAQLSLDTLVRQKLDSRNYVRLKTTTPLNGHEPDPLSLIERGLQILRTKKPAKVKR